MASVFGREWDMLHPFRLEIFKNFGPKSCGIVVFGLPALTKIVAENFSGGPSNWESEMQDFGRPTKVQVCPVLAIE